MPGPQESVKPIEISDSVFVKTIRLITNLLTNILMCFTVYVCIVFSCSSEVMTLFHWHIILCVLGYQFFMSQGTLVLSRYNSWSMHLSRRRRKQLHIAFQLVGFILVMAGSSIIVCYMTSHFGTVHGGLGLCAVVASFISILNGATVNYASKLSSSCILSIKFIHYLSGILTLFLSAGSLSAGFQMRYFKVWMSNDDAVTVLIFITWLVTALVALDFWIISANRLRKIL